MFFTRAKFTNYVQFLSQRQEKKILKKGDLVRFYSSVEAFQRDYLERNPGVVLATSSTKSTINFKSPGSAYVLWADGSMTKEHLTYLEFAKDG